MVLVTEPGKLKKSYWHNYIEKSYELVKAKLTKKMRQEFGL
jgi:predicted DNA-binding protein (MmcQ/YjbR family)